MIAISILTLSHRNLLDIFNHMDSTFHLANKTPASPSLFDSNDMRKSQNQQI